MNKALSICILRLSAIGDVCHTLAVVQAIQKQYPKYQITWIIGKTEINLVKNIPNVNFIIFDKKSGWKGILQLWSKLKSERFDILLNMQTALRASILSLGIKAKQKIGFSKDKSREMQWLFTNSQIEQTDKIHVLDHLMLFAKKIGVTNLIPSWELAIPKTDIEFVSQFINKNTKNILIAPCSSNKKRDWKPENYAKLANFLIKNNFNVIICGSPASNEQKVADKIQQLAPNCCNLAGKTNLIQLAALISQVDLVLSSDSGPAHIATTQYTPIIGLYAIQNPRRTGPYNNIENVISVYDEAVLESYGKSWQELPWATKAKGEDLMDRISVEEVKQNLKNVLSIQ